MASLTIAWEYLTGYAVATDTTNRDRAEWPPHPARVFMALVAAWAETEPPGAGDECRKMWSDERAALRWLEKLGDPEMRLPTVGDESERSNVTFFVPVNDTAGPSAATLQSCPALTRSKQARSFPRRWVGDGSCFLDWPDAEGADLHREALGRLCLKVTRLGHSSSLVSMRVADEAEPKTEDGTHLVPDDLQAKEQVRSLSRGTLAMLQERFGEAQELPANILLQSAVAHGCAARQALLRCDKHAAEHVDQRIAATGGQSHDGTTNRSRIIAHSSAGHSPRSNSHRHPTRADCCAQHHAVTNCAAYRTASHGYARADCRHDPNARRAAAIGQRLAQLQHRSIHQQQ